MGQWQEKIGRLNKRTAGADEHSRMITALQKCDAITEGSREAMGSGEESTKEVRQCWGYRSGTIRDVPVAGREGMPACSAGGKDGT